jgi:hypothetical protein
VTLAPEELRLRLRAVNRGLFNPTMLRRRRFDAHIVSMQQSGTHWLKYMLGHVLAAIHGLPPPGHIQDDAIVGHPKSPPIHAGIPQIVHSHSMPHYLMRSRSLMRHVHFPRYLILVRDMRDALVANYEKWKGEYACDFSTYLRGDVSGRRFDNDIWLQIRFLNEWGAMRRRHADRTHVIRYEDMKADTAAALADACRFLGITGAGPAVIAAAVAEGSKDRMAERPNPKVKLTVVRRDSRPAAAWFAPDDRAFFSATCRRNLRPGVAALFGYDFDRWPEAEEGAA